MPTIKRPELPGRDSRGKWLPGVSGNRQGRPLGARSRISRRVMETLEAETQDILGVLIRQAKAGDVTAARFLVSISIPKAKHMSADVGDLPELDGAAGIADAHEQVVRAMAAGRLDGDTAAQLSSLLAEQRRAVELVNLEARLAKLEAGETKIDLPQPRVIDAAEDDDS